MKLFTALIASMMLAGCGASLGLPGGVSDYQGSKDPPYVPSYYAIQNIHARWKQPTITYHIGSGNSVLVDFRAIIDREVSRWRPALSGLQNVVESDGTAKPDIEVDFVSRNDIQNLPLDYYSGGQAIGNTNVVVDYTTKTITHATIYVDQGQDLATLDDVVLHELGHAFGIDVHSPDKTDVMYPAAHTPEIITSRDYDTIRSVNDPRTNP